jgi:hypothetical protein
LQEFKASNPCPPELAGLLKNLAGVDNGHLDSLKKLAESGNLRSKE